MDPNDIKNEFVIRHSGGMPFNSVGATDSDLEFQILGFLTNFADEHNKGYQIYQIHHWKTAN